MRTIVTLMFALIAGLTFAQSQISVSSNGNFLKVFIDGNLQNPQGKAFLKVINIPQGQHVIEVRYANNPLKRSKQVMFLKAHKKYDFTVLSYNYQPQLALNAMVNAQNMFPNGVNVVNFSTNSFGNNNATLNPNCTCGNCFGTQFSCGSIHVNPNTGNCTCPPNSQFGQHPYHCPTHNPNSTVYYNQGTSVVTSNNPHGHQHHPQMPEYHGPVGCMKNRVNTTDLIAAMKAETWNDDKLNAGKIALKYYSLSVEDLRSALKLFTDDDERLDFAKFAYAHTIDIANFYKLKSEFTFSSSKEKFTQYVQSK